jgi:hypothetical protein
MEFFYNQVHARSEEKMLKVMPREEKKYICSSHHGWKL